MYVNKVNLARISQSRWQSRGTVTLASNISQVKRIQTATLARSSQSRLQCQPGEVLTVEVWDLKQKLCAVSQTKILT